MVMPLEKHSVFAIPYCELDAEIVPLVRLLNENGFTTTHSCQGSEGHSFKCPTVGVLSNGDLDETRKALCAFLLSKGAEGFTVKTVSMHQRSEIPESYSYVEVELWSYETLRYFVSWPLPQLPHGGRRSLSSSSVTCQLQSTH